jgi:hypothetical protein
MPRNLYGGRYDVLDPIADAGLVDSPKGYGMSGSFNPA